MTRKARVGTTTGGMMCNTFTLTIDLGNDAMQTPQDVAEALRGIAEDLDERVGVFPERRGVRDGNGNTVGRYFVT
jgi:hypothetical protein